MGTEQNKLLIKLEGKSVIQWTLNAFEEHPWVDEIVVITGDRQIIAIADTFSKMTVAVAGGESRQASIKKGLTQIEYEHAIIVVHDGARPNVTEKVISEVIAKAAEFGAAIAAVEAVDTIKRAKEGRVIETLDRSELVRAQTPQAFRGELLRKAYAQDNLEGTDDASLIERLGHPVQIVKGDYRNIKVTLPEDVDYLKYLRGAGQMNYRVGSGYDVHRLVEGRKMILGGVEIPHAKGLDGHSDADVLLHAIMDAMLGAAGQGDIGRWFSDQDEKYSGISSMILLKRVDQIIKNAGYRLMNIDATVIAQKPKLADYIEKMELTIADALNIESDRVNIKATTTERLGFTGREEGIAAEAIAMVDKI
jgi:2-C-methyl-D-erythritol 4-phosphate cytidylyltransferase/2-C-methyl-D-erythritol 2,4-cyclodiphosphate synthase